VFFEWDHSRFAHLGLFANDFFNLFRKIASSANRFVHFGTTNELNLLAIDYSLGKCCLFCAIDANSIQFGHFLCFWDKIKNVSKRLSLESTVKSCYNDNFIFVSHNLTVLYNLGEELRLIDAYNIIGS
jgi:hypothetical protein